jgi:hypothetical protein
MTTLAEVARSGGSTARGAAALIEAGYAGDTRLEALTPGSVTRTLVEVLARELAELYEQLGAVYEGAFIETETQESLEALLDRLVTSPRREAS